VVQDALGRHIYEHFLEAKRNEWQEYIERVSGWEITRYLAVY
jgi:glutamine synthetase